MADEVPITTLDELQRELRASFDKQIEAARTQCRHLKALSDRVSGLDDAAVAGILAAETRRAQRIIEDLE